MSLAQPLQTRMADDGRDPFTLKLSFEPSPGVASDPEAPKVATDLRGLMSRPPGEYGLAVAGGILLGAATDYRAAGLPSVCYTRSLSSQDASGITVEISYCGWLTAPGDTWAPKSLPPQDRAAPVP